MDNETGCRRHVDEKISRSSSMMKVMGGGSGGFSNWQTNMERSKGSQAYNKLAFRVKGTRFFRSRVRCTRTSFAVFKSSRAISGIFTRDDDLSQCSFFIIHIECANCKGEVNN